MLLIIGCPHSGTMFTAKVLQRAGVPCGHEAIYTLWGYKPGALDVVAEVSWEAVFYLDLDLVPSPVVVGHQTREPIAWLNSWARMSEHAGVAAWELLENKFPGILARRRQDSVSTAMWLWVEMNRRCARHTRHRYRVEALREEQGLVILDGLCRAAGISLDRQRARRALNSVDRDVNHHPGLSTYVAQTWESLPRGAEFEEFKDLARAYGYLPT